MIFPSDSGEGSTLEMGYDASARTHPLANVPFYPPRCIGGEVCEVSPAGVPQNELSKRQLSTSREVGTPPGAVGRVGQGDGHLVDTQDRWSAPKRLHDGG
jgi:hypothetical protein